MPWFGSHEQGSGWYCKWSNHKEPACTQRTTKESEHLQYKTFLTNTVQDFKKQLILTQTFLGLQLIISSHDYFHFFMME